MEGLHIPRLREEDSHPKILPYPRRISLEPKPFLALYTCGVNTRGVFRFLEGIYGALLLAPEQSPASPRWWKGKYTLGIQRLLDEKH